MSDGSPTWDAARHARLLGDLVDTSVDGIFAYELSGRIVLWNKGAERILGYGADEARQQVRVDQLFAPGTAQTLLARLRSTEYGGVGKLLRHEVTARAKDGAEIPISLSGGILYDEHGGEQAIFGLFRDLRALREMQARLLQSEKMAGLGRLAAGVAHELNNPMSGILLFVHLVLERLGDDHPAAPDLRVIAREAERCKEIVGDLLTFSQKGEPRHESVDVNDQVRQALDLVSRQPEWSMVRVHLYLEENLSRVWGDAVRFQQVILNLLVNAAQAMDGHGQVTVTTRHRRERDVVELLIHDNGPGIAPEIQSRIFDPFFTTKAARGGTGLGLSVCYAIVKEHKGTIHVESTVGMGTTFRVQVPAMHLAALGDDAL